jgi:hypothetical protein
MILSAYGFLFIIVFCVDVSVHCFVFPSFPAFYGFSARSYEEVLKNPLRRRYLKHRGSSGIDNYVDSLKSMMSSSEEKSKLSPLLAKYEKNTDLSSSLLPNSVDLFCNAELPMDYIQAVGFDMDYTLAEYKEEFDLLHYEKAKEKLVTFYNYPSEILNLLHYNSSVCRRGCILDTERGNVIKVDEYRYPRIVEHGLTKLSPFDRKTIYRESYYNYDTFSNHNFVYLDTPFSLVDATLYVQLVDLKGKIKNNENDVFSSSTRLFFDRQSYSQLWTHVKKCVGVCHMDGIIKKMVATNPEQYINYDSLCKNSLFSYFAVSLSDCFLSSLVFAVVFPMFDQFRNYNKKVFLLTNSYWEYTHVVMNYLEGKKTGNKKDFQWMEHFDMIIVGGNKPAFMLDEGYGILSLTLPLSLLFFLWCFLTFLETLYQFIALIQ